MPWRIVRNQCFSFRGRMNATTNEPIFLIGRMVSWLIVALMLASALYAATMAVLNWSTIKV